jgi:hypothetical protein
MFYFLNYFTDYSAEVKNGGVILPPPPRLHEKAHGQRH